MIPYSHNDAVAVTLVQGKPELATALEETGHRWQYARNASEALHLLETRPSPVVLTEVRLPNHEGPSLVRKLCDRSSDISLLVLAELRDVPAASYWLREGVRAFLVRPITPEKVVRVLELTLERHRRAARVGAHSPLLRGSIRELLLALGAHSPATLAHSRRVRHYAMILAAALRLDERHRREIGLAGLLHDVGKLAIPEAILNKPHSLSVEESAAIREHPELGATLVEPIYHQARVLAGIRGHHERQDGSGYPAGLSGHNIPLEARILSIADIFDALTSNRSYRPTITIPSALTILEHPSSRLDLELVRAFAAELRRHPGLTLQTVSAS